MSWVTIPVTSAPDNTMSVALDVNGLKTTLLLRFRYNVIGGYWAMDIGNAIDGSIYLTGVPLLQGDFPAADILHQYHYKGIGRAVVVRLTDVTTTDDPKEKNLGVEFTLAWGDDDEPVDPEVANTSNDGGRNLARRF